MKRKLIINFLSIWLFLLPFSHPASAKVMGSGDTRYLVIIDASSSMRVNKSIVSEILGRALIDDTVASRIALVVYPSSSGTRIYNFQNSAEFDFTLNSFEYLRGSTDLEAILNKGLVWSSEFSSNNRRALWITDGGGLSRLSDSESTYFGQMREITDLNNWTVIEISDSASLAKTKDTFGSYVNIGEATDMLAYDFQIRASSPLSLEDSLDSQTPNFNLASTELRLILGISLMATLSVTLMIVALIRSIKSRKKIVTRRKVLRNQFFGQELAELDQEYRLWRTLPSFLKKPVNSLEDHYNLTDKSKSQVLLGAIALIFVSVLVISSNIFFAAISSFIGTPYLLSTFKKFLHGRESKSFTQEFPGFLMLLSSGLKSGLSLEQGIDAYCSQTSGIAAREFKRVLTEVRMGLSLEESLGELSRRRQNDDLTWLVTAINIQKSVGGSLSTIIDTVLETIGGRSEVRREIKSLSAEGKLSAYVLIALPIFIFLFLLLTRRKYVAVLWTEPIGILILSLIGILIFIGWIWMRKVVNIRV